jgi:hypothetical protein
MKSDSAVRKPQMTDPHRGLHLVHSRKRQQGRSRIKQPARTHDAQSKLHFGESRPAPLFAPIAKMGRALMRLIRVT